ncbi:hypothetical protein [Pseudoalteromonas prydzensis]|uniref:hypothetical protein n=1 Tax=Pseudoalteromonas prydzensis TaxID=182141 RepID=UPI0007E51C56|nr:hypothetical protein [Pseudoalteromonas prydzensis]MBE0376985.1 hypothetical protein [Pseudoalteromonas prydzensis ACAM 620]
MQISQFTNSSINQYINPRVNRLESPIAEKEKNNEFNLEGKTNIIYKIDDQNIHKASNEKTLQLGKDFWALSSSLENTEKYYRENGKQIDVAAMVKIDGQVMGYLNYDGSYAGREGVNALFAEAGGDINSLKQLIDKHYSGSGSLEVFPEGHGPTNAEVFELFNNESYESFISGEINARKEAQTAEQMNIDSYLRRKLLFEDPPQTSVFKIDGKP